MNTPQWRPTTGTRPPAPPEQARAARMPGLTCGASEAGDQRYRRSTGLGSISIHSCESSRLSRSMFVEPMSCAPCVSLSLAKSENQTTCTPARWSVVRFEATAAASLAYRASFSLQLVLHWQPAGESVVRHHTW